MQSLPIIVFSIVELRILILTKLDLLDQLYFNMINSWYKPILPNHLNNINLIIEIGLSINLRRINGRKRFLTNPITNQQCIISSEEYDIICDNFSKDCKLRNIQF